MLLKLFFQNFWNQNTMREESSGNRACILPRLSLTLLRKKKPKKTRQNLFCTYHFYDIYALCSINDASLLYFLMKL